MKNDDCLHAKKTLIEATACLISSTYDGDLESVKNLIENHNIDINARDLTCTGCTPIHIAAAKGYINILKYLLSHDADVNVIDDFGRTPLHQAVRYGQLEICKYLIDNGANPEALTFNGENVFDFLKPHLLFKSNYSQKLKDLLEHSISMKESNDRVEAIYDFGGASEMINPIGDELKLHKGDVFKVLERDEINWWLVQNIKTGDIGHVPRLFIQ